MSAKNLISSVIEATRFSFENRHLAYEMSRKEVLERAHGQAFGRFWMFFHPLLLIGVYSFVFIGVVKMRLPSAQSSDGYGFFVLSGLVVWLGCADSMSRAAIVLRTNTALIKQVIFPIEVLPISSVFSALFTQSVFLMAYLPMYWVVRGHLLWTFLLLPIVVCVQVIGLLGLSFFISAVSVYFKDIREILQAYLTVAVYTLPIFFDVDKVPEAGRWLVEYNPFGSVVYVFRDVLFIGSISQPIHWTTFTLGSLLVFGSGFRFFRRVKIHFGSVL